MTAWSLANLDDMELNDSEPGPQRSVRDPFADGGWACGGLVAGCELQSHEWDVDYLTARERLAALLLMSANIFDWWPGHQRRLLRDSAFALTRLELCDPQQTWECFVGPEVHGQRMHYWLLPIREATRRGMHRRHPLRSDLVGVQATDIDALRRRAGVGLPDEHLFSPRPVRGQV